ncbi:proton-coupled zinc antiporter SLC30A1-like [Asterias amurensis]|uniref:proton-coupled zinc antiporter SLC30A1-like n=1 Tax=Asterias amurensis TaxID=7602 RepID=UPI003AB3E9E9
MGRYTGKSCRFLVMMLLTSTFFLVELITGYITNSLALVSDSFHMMSDIIALVIGFLAMRLSKKTTPKNTFGWQRSEVLGALVNSVFLMALCFTIFVEAIQRFINKENITNPLIVLIVGIIGLVINGFGLCLFSSHGMSHGHSHGGGGHGHSHKNKKNKEVTDGSSADTLTPLRVGSDKQLSEVKVEVGDSGDEPTPVVEDDDENTNDGSSAAQLNMRGVFLHVLGDALGSVVVIISAGLILAIGSEHDWVHYVDPAMSLIIVAIITITTMPLFRQSSMILLQSIPAEIDLDKIERQLKEKVVGIANVHELHVWQLSGNKYIATAHVLFHSMEDYTVQAQKIKSYLHDQGIHSTTIQPEFIGDYPTDAVDGMVCKILCKPDSVCEAQKCCDDNKKSKRKSIDQPSSPTPNMVNTSDFSSNPMDQDV